MFVYNASKGILELIMFDSRMLGDVQANPSPNGYESTKEKIIIAYIQIAAQMVSMVPCFQDVINIGII